MHPIGRREGHFDGERERHHDVAGDEDDEIGRRIVGALVEVLLAAHLATVDDLEKGAKPPALAAIGAAAAPAAPHRLGERALRAAGEDERRVHRRRPMRWPCGGRSARSVPRSRRPRRGAGPPPAHRPPRPPLPPENRRTRAPPAPGTASTSRTETRSPSRWVSPERSPIRARLSS